MHQITVNNNILKILVLWTYQAITMVIVSYWDLYFGGSRLVAEKKNY